MAGQLQPVSGAVGKRSVLSGERATIVQASAGVVVSSVFCRTGRYRCKGCRSGNSGRTFSAGFAQPHRVDAHDGGRFREEVEVGDRAEIGVNVPGIEQDALPDEAFVIKRRRRPCRCLPSNRLPPARFSGAVPRQDLIDFELCRSVRDAAETEQGGEEAFHLFVVWTQR